MLHEQSEIIHSFGLNCLITSTWQNFIAHLMNNLRAIKSIYQANNNTYKKKMVCSIKGHTAEKRLC